MTVKAFAPAKVNLTLHVTGKRTDGYHLLDSLVVFVDVGDQLSVSLAKQTSLEISGPFAQGVPTGADNLILAAAGLFDGDQGLSITLEKNLPMASGIGGGSADAAATLRAIGQLLEAQLPVEDAILRLGADVPVCLLGKSARMQGVGENLVQISVPPLDLVLINPGVGIATVEVFAALDHVDNAPMTGVDHAATSLEAFKAWLGEQRNDLENPAIRIAPVIGETLNALRSTKGCLVARMSGSGATCFGVFQSSDAAQKAAREISSAHPDWWVRATKTLN